ncbi:unnamed protein product, partial [Rotaria sordida]
MKYFSKLVSLYIQNQKIINAIVKCLCSKYYVKMFERIGSDEFLLISCPMYWIAYTGSDKEETANILLNALLPSSIRLLQLKPSKHVTHLLDLLNHSFALCSSTIFTNNNLLVPITYTLLSIISDQSISEESQSMIKSILRLLLTLINNNQMIFQCVQQRQELFQNLIGLEDEAYIILVSIMNDSEIKSMINSNETFALCVQKYIEQQNDTNHFLTTRLKSILASPVNAEETTVPRIPPTTLLFQSIFTSNENENKEGITLMWYDKNIGIRDDTKKTIELLQKVNDYVLICSNRQTCIEYIDQIKTEKVFLILSGITAQDILDEIHDHQQIDSFYIFCMEPEKYEIYLNNNIYSKVNGIYTKYEPLLNALQENIRYSMKQSEAISLFDQDERSMRNLKEEIHTFKYFRVFKQVLLKTEYNNDTAKNDMIEICRNYYRKNKKELSNIDKFEQTYKSEDAIRWYTKQTFVYRLVNKALRTEDYEAMIILRFFIVNLSENLRQEYEDYKKKQNKYLRVLILYRGLKLPFAEVYSLKHNIGKTIATNGFLSTTRSKYVAYRFAKKGIKRTDVETVILEIEIDFKKLTVPFIDIAQYSDFPNEQEILFDLGASFIIKSADYDTDQKIWLVKLSAVSEETPSKYTQVLLEEYKSETDMNILLGKLLYKMEKYGICRRVFEKLLNFYGSEEYEKLATIYNFIGESYAYENDYDKAIVNYTKAYNYYIKLRQFQDAAIVTNYIGVAYFNKNDKENARFYCTKSQDMWKELPTYTPEYIHCEIGYMLNLCGCLEDDNQIACDYFLKALKIYENPSKMCNHIQHDHRIAEICENLAYRYNQDNDNDKALEYIMKSVNIRKTNISSLQKRKNYISCLEILRQICGKIHTNIWSEYADQFRKLSDTEDIDLLSRYKQALDTPDNIRRSHFKHNYNISESSKFLEYSLKTLKFISNKNSTNYENIIQAHIDIAHAYANTKDYHWSRQHCEKALEIYQTNALNNPKLMSTVFELLSNTYLHNNNFDEAFNLRMNALTTDDTTHHLAPREKEAQCYFDLGYELLGTNPDKALEFTNKSLEIRLEILPEDHVAIGFCYQDIGTAYENKSMFDEAIKHYKEAIEIYEQHLFDEEEYQFNVREVYGLCHSNIAGIYTKQGGYDSAFNFKMIALTIDKKTCHLTEKEKEAQCYYDLGYTLVASSPDKALEFSKKSLEIRLEILPEDHATIGFCHHDIGVAYYNKSMFDEAIKHYKEAIEIYEKHLFDEEEYQFNVREVYGLCHSNIAGIYTKQDDYDSTFNFKMKALSIDKKTRYLTEKEKEAQCFFDIGEELLDKDSDKALEFTKKSLEIRLEILPEDHVTIGFCHQDIGVAYENKSMIDEAIKHYKEAIEIYEKHLFDEEQYQFNVIKCYSQCHSNIGTISLTNDYGTLTEYYEKAIKIMENDDVLHLKMKALNIGKKTCHLTEKEKEARWYYNLGCALVATSPDKALEFINKSLEIRLEILPEDHATIGLCHHDIGWAYR